MGIFDLRFLDRSFFYVLIWSLGLPYIWRNQVALHRVARIVKSSASSASKTKMVYIHFPANFTEEEENLRLKYAKLRKKRKALQALKSVKPDREPAKEQPQKRPAESAEDAKEQAKKLLKSGAIKISDKNQEKHRFKRSRNLEKKLSDPEKTPTSVGFQPFAATHPDEEQEEKEDKTEPRERGEKRPRGPRARGLYDSFIRGDRLNPNREEDRDHREREPLPKKGNTVYVKGHGVNEEIFRKAFSNFGKILNISMETDKNCGFVTFEKTEAADIAIQEVNGAVVDSVQLKVSMARRQPTFEQSQDPSPATWSSIASNTSQKGSHKDKRNIVEYDEDIF